MSMVKQRPMPPKSVKLPKKRKVMRQVSEKKALEDKIYKVRRIQFLIDHRCCQFPGCLAHAQHVHHRHGRGRYYLVESTWMAACLTHHDWIESHKNEARKLGLITYK